MSSPKRKNGRGRKPNGKGAPNGAVKNQGFDPIHTAIRARFVPFDTEKGIASPLDDGRPAQKFMAKAQQQISLSSGQGMVFMACPNVASDANYLSLVVAVGATTGGQFTTDGAWNNLTVGNLVGPWGTMTGLATNTPYTASALVASGTEYTCVGSGLKFTYEGAELYRGGTIRYIVDKEFSYNVDANWTVDTVNGLIGFVNSSPNTIRQSINKENVVEMNTSVSGTGLVTYREATATAYTAGGGTSDTAIVGGTTSTFRFGLRPALLGYYINTSGNAISFHVDVVEHWAVSSPTIQSLQTPSYAHVAMATHVDALMDNVRQNHAGAPNTKHLDVTKSTLAALKSPIGHELLNAGLRAALL